MSTTRPAAALRVERLRKTYGAVTALDDLSLDIRAGAFTAVVGPSGCGKSTLLSIVAGLLEPDGGDVLLDGSSIGAVAAQQRPVSLVFQKPLLFPHLDVAQNVGFGLRMQRVPKEHARKRVAAIIDALRLDDLVERRVGELSGGQEQRVALARALVLEPRVLLLDEPFSQLDATLRAEMRALVRRLHDELDLTTVFVTHDQAEAVEVADDIALILDGAVAGHGAAQLFYRRPPSLAAARFFGVQNEIAGTVTEGVLRTDGGVSFPAPRCADGPAVLVVRPEAIGLGASADASVRAVDGLITAARFAGTHLALEVRTERVGVLHVHAPIDRRVEVGARTTVTLPLEACTVLPADAR